MSSIKKRSNDSNIQMVLDALEDSQNKIALLFSEMKDLREKDMKEIRDRVLQLPCGVHVEKFKTYDDHITRHNDLGWAVFLLVIGFVGTLVALGNSWGRLNRSVEEHHKTAEKVFDICCPGVPRI